MKSQIIHKKQNGAVTLLTALVLLIGITLVTLVSSKTVLVQMQIAADNYRMAQAVAAATAALDFGIGYFDGGPTQLDNTCKTTNNTVVAGFDHDGNGIIDAIPDKCTEYESSDTTQKTSAFLTFNNSAGTRCVDEDATPNMKSGLITAVGYSDDNLAMRTISQCVGTVNVLGSSPKQSMITRSGIGLTGNYKIINRYFNTTAWSGSAVNIGASASASTYLRPVGTRESDYTRAQLEDADTSNAYTSQPVSDRDKGNGVDTIANDPGLAALTGDNFFNNFFFSDRSTVKKLAESLGQVYPAANVGAADGKSEVVWIEGNASINGGTYGTLERPIIFIVDGNLNASGNPKIKGLLYVRGQLNAAGSVGVLGSVVVEGDQGLVPPGRDPVVGHGGVDLIYSPYTLDRAPNPIVGSTTAISGSWRDW